MIPILFLDKKKRTMKSCILILLCLFQCCTSTEKRYQNDLEELLDILVKQSPANFEERNHKITKDDNPNDRVDVELWNKLNKEDIENMPQIDDYSDEVTAARWLKWYFRVSLRYSQVNTNSKKFR
jgi:hypothetical protein